MYNIDLTMLLRLFGEFQRSGSLRAEVPPGVFGLKEPGFVQIDLQQGKIIACFLRNKDGSIHRTGNVALRIAQETGGLQWQVKSEMPPTTITSPLLAIAPPPYQPSLPATPAHISGKLIPWRIVTPNRSILNSLTFRQRRILNITDGKRTVTQLANLLSASVEEVQVILDELNAMGLIAIKQ